MSAFNLDFCFFKLPQDEFFGNFNSTKCHVRYVHVECFDCRICRKRKKTTNEHTRTHAQIRTCIHKLLHNINDSINFVLASLIRIDRYERLLACYKRMYHLILIGSLALFLLSKQSKKSLKRLIYCFLFSSSFYLELCGFKYLNALLMLYWNRMHLSP